MKTTIIILLLTLFTSVSFSQTQGTLTVSTLTSATVGAAYDPDNIMAIWIVNSSGTFVKSLLVYAATRQQYLYTWIASNSSLNKVDAITGATQTSHGTRVCSWNGKNVNEVVVPDGTYTVKMELTDKHAQGNLGSFAFVKGPGSQTLTPAAVPSFASINIKWNPLATGLDEVPISDLYSVYPNPTNSTIFIAGNDILEVEVSSINGSHILSSKLPYIDLSVLTKGVYLVTIKTKAGTAVKKVEKN